MLELAERRGEVIMDAELQRLPPLLKHDKRVRETGGKEGDNLIELHGGGHCFTNKGRAHAACRRNDTESLAL